MKKKLVLVTFVLGVAALWAADGVIEINQATVEANGGFPYVISEPGSYKLTGHLSVLNTTAIEVRADDVTLDLNGFAIGCGGLFDPDDPCELGNRGEGVTAFFVSGENSDNASNTVVRNGTIRQMGFHGVNIDSGFVERIQALENGGLGILVGAGAVTDCLARSNGATGIQIQKGVATTNIAILNGGVGISVRHGVVQNNTSAANGASGIKSEGSALILGNRVFGNSGLGLNLNQDDLNAVSGYTDNVIDGVVTDSTGEAQPIGCNLVGGNLVCPEGSAAQGASGP